MTYRPKSDFLHVMSSRGFMQDCTDTEGLDDALLAGPLPAYIGFDATATSLHVGSLIQIMMLRWLQKTGHKPITLMGGGTTKVGDPSFRSDERPLLTPDRIAANIAGIRQVFAKYVTYGDSRHRRGDARQRRMARRAELSRFPARCRPALLGQPHARRSRASNPASTASNPSRSSNSTT